jgi:hypothetical protein
MEIHLTIQGPGALAVLAALTLGGCRNPDPAAERADSVPVVRDGPFGRGAITGVVRFVGTAPANPPIDMRAAPQCRAIYHGAPQQLSVVVNPNGTLANVFVHVIHGLPPGSRYAAPADTMLVTQRGCQYHPRVLGVMVGQALAFRNDDVVPHRLEASGVKTRPLTRVQPPGRRSAHVFRNGDVMVPLECGMHPWMRAYVGILPHPFFATTNRSGRFTIPRLPPGTYTLEAWHEGYGRRIATVSVTDSTTTHVTFSFAATPDGSS